MSAADLFESHQPAAPLAERLRPKDIDEVIRGFARGKLIHMETT